MLATHSPKFLDQTIKVKGIQKVIDCEVPKHFICSKNIGLRQLFWACPTNAADIKTWREISAKVQPLVEDKTIRSEALDITLNDQPVIQEFFPEDMDGEMKSVLLPFDYVDEEKGVEGIRQLPYVAVTPVPSLGVIHEVFKRGFELGRSNPLIQQTLQPNPMALSNHGETLLMQAGRYRAFEIHVPRTYDLLRPRIINKEDELVFPYLVFIAKVGDANVNAGLIAQGIPSITALGGFVHMLERETKQNIDFAVGFREVGVHEGKKRYINQSMKNKANLKNGVASNTRFTLNETTGSFEIVFLFKCKKQNALLYHLLNKPYRIAGGHVHEILYAGHKIQQSKFQYAWLYNQSKFTDKINDFFEKNPTVKVHSKDEDGKIISEHDADLLDCAFHLHTIYENYNSYGILSNGYILLEEPQQRTSVRTNGYKHAFAEPIFCLINLCTEFDDTQSFWKRFHTKNLVYWN